MPHSAKDTLGKHQQSFDSSSFLLFVTAAHIHLSTPFHPFISFPDWSKVLICQGSLPAPPAVTGTLRAGCFPVCWCRWNGSGCAGSAGDRRLLLAGILVEPLVFQAGTGSGSLTTRFWSARMFAALSWSAQVLLLTRSVLQRHARPPAGTARTWRFPEVWEKKDHTKRGSTQKCRYRCYYVDREDMKQMEIRIISRNTRTISEHDCNCRQREIFSKQGRKKK